MGRQLQYPDASGWNIVGPQKYKVGRRIDRGLTGIGKLCIPTHGGAILTHAGKFNIDCQRPTYLSPCRHLPHMPAGRDITAFNQHPAADKTSPWTDGIDINQRLLDHGDLGN
jgi:hypothetical protein